MKLPQTVNILLLGSGGREHALAWKIAQSGRTGKLYVAPGNAGTASVGMNVELVPTNFGTVKQFILTNNINLVVVGPEDPLVKGLADYLGEDPDTHHVPVIGPVMAGARLEGSKEFAKEFMNRHGIPTASHRSFTKDKIEEAYEYLATLRPPYVLKANGLAAGKGVIITPDIHQARQTIDEMFSGKFGTAGNTVVIEEYLDGIECSVFVAIDGKNYCILPTAKDYKRIGVGDTGPNTGGMGAVSPVPFAGKEFMQKVRERIIEPSVQGLISENIEYKGFLFIGLMNVNGDPYVIEYNVRLGDPETEVIVPRISSDIIDLFEAIAFGTLDKFDIEIDPRFAVTVICAAGGYPDEYAKGDEISGLDTSSSGTMIFQAGTCTAGGKIVTNGGRVLAVTSFGDTIQEAAKASYSRIDGIVFDNKYFRTDIGKDLI